MPDVDLSLSALIEWHEDQADCCHRTARQQPYYRVHAIIWRQSAARHEATAAALRKLMEMEANRV